MEGKEKENGGFIRSVLRERLQRGREITERAMGSSVREGSQFSWGLVLLFGFAVYAVVNFVLAVLKFF